MMDREAIRQSFRPDKVRLLFVGEAPPIIGAHFYGGGHISKHMATVFASVFSRSFSSSDEFLAFFKREGCYFVDLSHEPISHMPDKIRRRCVVACVIPLALRIRQCNPEHVIGVTKGIEHQVRKAAQMAEIDSSRVFCVPVPLYGKRTLFMKDLTALLMTIYEPINKATCG